MKIRFFYILIVLFLAPCISTAQNFFQTESFQLHKINGGYFTFSESNQAFCSAPFTLLSIHSIGLDFMLMLAQINIIIMQRTLFLMPKQ